MRLAWTVGNRIGMSRVNIPHFHSCFDPQVGFDKIWRGGIDKKTPRLSAFHPGSGAWLAALCTSRVLAATWFVAYSAVLPLTQAQWDLSGREAGLIQSAFHLGYCVSLFIVGFIADHFGARRA